MARPVHAMAADSSARSGSGRDRVGDGRPAANDNGAATAYAYDALGRPASRAVAGSAAETFGYDAIGRMNADGHDLGTFTIDTAGVTPWSETRKIGTVGLC
jgi:YD repeat-containing protein